ncbi:3962_t:CDS:2, partial [Ambispora gerdemannii]
QDMGVSSASTSDNEDGLHDVLSVETIRATYMRETAKFMTISVKEIVSSASTNDNDEDGFHKFTTVSLREDSTSQMSKSEIVPKYGANQLDLMMMAIIFVLWNAKIISRTEKKTITKYHLPAEGQNKNTGRFYERSENETNSKDILLEDTSDIKLNAAIRTTGVSSL